MLDQETKDLILELAEEVGLDWEQVDFQPEDLFEGYEIELEHGTSDPRTDVTGDDPEMTLKISWAHLNENKSYYKKLKKYIEK